MVCLTQPSLPSRDYRRKGRAIASGLAFLWHANRGLSVSSAARSQETAARRKGVAP